jgi:hypothetical protein
MFNSKKNLLVILLISLMCLAIVGNTSLATAKKGSIDIYPGDSIQNAIDTAPLGATIVVHTGTYTLTDTITISQTQQVTLTGKSAVLEYAKPTSTSGSAVINVLGDNVQISGFTIHASYATGAEHTLLTGIEIGRFNPIVSPVGCVVDSNTIVSPDWGVSGYGQQAFTVSNNVISAEFPIWFTSPHNAIIKNNIITAQTYPTGPTFPSIGYTTNTIVGQMAGIKLTNDVQSCSIKNNQITSEAFGILVCSGTPATVIPTNVEIIANQITAHDGIYANVGNNFIIKNNIVNVQLYGIWIADSQGTGTKIAGNSVTMPNTNIYDVYPGDSIQNAIDIASLGATIFVHPGTYSLAATITINKQVILTGTGAVLEYAKPTSASGYPAIDVLADNVQIIGLTIHASYATGAEHTLLTGIEIGRYGGSNPANNVVTVGCVVDSNTIVSPDWGVSGYGQQAFTVSNNVISAEFPIWFTSPHNAIIKNNIITAQTYPTGPTIPTLTAANLFQQMAGIKVTGSADSCSISNNQIGSNDFGILIADLSGIARPSNIEIANNRIQRSVNGIYGEAGSNYVINANTVNSQSTGICFSDNLGSAAIISNNVITSKIRGIAVGNSENFYITYNRVTIGNTDPAVFATGVDIVNYAQYGQIGFNTITGNFKQAVELVQADHNTFTGNTITGGNIVVGDMAFSLSYANYNQASGNTISAVYYYFGGIGDYNEFSDVITP